MLFDSVCLSASALGLISRLSALSESLVLFGLQPIKFTDVAEVAGMMSLKLSLWESQEEWAAIVSQWESTRFGELEIPDLEQTVVKYMRTVARLERGLMPNKVLALAAQGT